MSVFEEYGAFKGKHIVGGIVFCKLFPFLLRQPYRLGPFLNNFNANKVTVI